MLKAVPNFGHKTSCLKLSSYQDITSSGPMPPFLEPTLKGPGSRGGGGTGSSGGACCGACCGSGGQLAQVSFESHGAAKWEAQNIKWCKKQGWNGTEMISKHLKSSKPVMFKSASSRFHKI